MAAASDAFGAFWADHGAAHFVAEEEILLPRMAAAGGFDEEVVGRVLRDHAEIRLAALEVQAGSVDVARLHGLGERLLAHVRLEEQELFPRVEASLSQKELSDLPRELAEAERSSGQA